MCQPATFALALRDLANDYIPGTPEYALRQVQNFTTFLRIVMKERAVNISNGRAIQMVD